MGGCGWGGVGGLQCRMILIFLVGGAVGGLASSVWEEARARFRVMAMLMTRFGLDVWAL